MDAGHAETEKLIKKIEKDISKEYKKAHKEIEKKFNDYVKRLDKEDVKWKKLVDKGLRTKEEYQDWLIKRILTGERWRELRDTLATDYANVSKISNSIVTGYKPEAYAINYNYGTYEIEHGTGIETSFTLYNAETVERLYRENPKIFKDASDAVEQLIKEGKLKRWSNKQIRSVMTQGILQGDSIPDLAKRLQRVTNGFYADSVRNARTMMTAVQSAGRIDSYQRAVDMGIPVKKQWMAALDGRTRHAHRDLDGEAIELDEVFTNEFGDIAYPGDPDADGANIYNCRCTLVASIEGFENDFSDMSWRYDSKLMDMDYETWKEGKS